MDISCWTARVPEQNPPEHVVRPLATLGSNAWAHLDSATIGVGVGMGASEGALELAPSRFVCIQVPYVI